MSYRVPEIFATYRRKSDGVTVIVGGCTGAEWSDSVLCRTADGPRRTWHVRLENFWKKYEETQR